MNPDKENQHEMATTQDPDSAIKGMIVTKNYY